MKIILYFLSSLFLIALTARSGLLGVFVLLLCLGLLVALYWLVRKHFRHLKELRYHARLTEPIILLAQFDGDDEIYQRAKHHQRYITLSGNRNHITGIDAQGREIKEPIKVHAIYQNFPSENYGETWEEYQNRAKEEKIKILRLYHQYLYNDGRHEWYLNKVLKQKI